MEELLRCLGLYTCSLAAGLSSSGLPVLENSLPQEWVCGLFTLLTINLAACLGRGSCWTATRPVATLLPYCLGWPLLQSHELAVPELPPLLCLRKSVLEVGLLKGPGQSKQVPPGSGCHSFLRSLVVFGFQTSCLCLWRRTVGQEAGYLSSASPTLRPGCQRSSSHKGAGCAGCGCG